MTADAFRWSSSAPDCSEPLLRSGPVAMVARALAMEHDELVREMALVERLTTQERLKLARRRRKEQLRLCLARERDNTAGKRRKSEENWSQRRRNRDGRIHFVDGVVLLEAPSRNDVEEGKERGRGVWGERTGNVGRARAGTGWQSECNKQNTRAGFFACMALFIIFSSSVCSFLSDIACSKGSVIFLGCFSFDGCFMFLCMFFCLMLEGRFYSVSSAFAIFTLTSGPKYRHYR